MQSETKAPIEETKVVQLIVFNLGDEEYGADIRQVREIVPRGDITAIPDSPSFIKGVTNVRGEITVVINLKARFMLTTNKEVGGEHIVITEQERNLFGLMVDEVTEVLRIPEKVIKPTPELVTKIDRVYISGVITLEERLILLIDLAKVLSEEELAKLAAFAQTHRVAAEKTKEREGSAEETPTVPVAQQESEASGDEKKKGQDQSNKGRKVRAEPSVAQRNVSAHRQGSTS